MSYVITDWANNLLIDEIFNTHEEVLEHFLVTQDTYDETWIRHLDDFNKTQLVPK